MAIMTDLGYICEHKFMRNLYVYLDITDRIVVDVYSQPDFRENYRIEGLPDPLLVKREYLQQAVSVASRKQWAFLKSIKLLGLAPCLITRETNALILVTLNLLHDILSGYLPEDRFRIHELNGSQYASLRRQLLVTGDVIERAVGRQKFRNYEGVAHHMQTEGLSLPSFRELVGNDWPEHEEKERVEDS